MNTLICPPTYIEKKFKNMVRGSIKQGSYMTLQMGYNRPNLLFATLYFQSKGFMYAGPAHIREG